MPSIFDSLNKPGRDAVRVTITPEMAMELLQANTINRPLDHTTLNRIAFQIVNGKWKFNGDTIKISTTQDILDGQHRLWAIIEAKVAVDSLVVFGVDKEAFDTIDTLRKFRTLGDVIAVEGQQRHRNNIGQALAWLVRYERGVLETYKAPANRIENSDVKEAFRNNPNIVQAVARAAPLRRLINTGLLGFFYYVAAAQNTALAEQMIEILNDPGKTKLAHPFYLLRTYLLSELALPAVVEKILMVIFALVCLLILWQLFSPNLRGVNWWGRD